MASTKYQLEIIDPGGKVKFEALDPKRGLTNIGRHHDNDVIVDSPGLALFHAMVDHRQEPCRVMLLTQEGVTTLNGQRLSPNVFHELRPWSTLTIDGHTLVLVESGAAAPPPPMAVEPVARAEPADWTQLPVAVLADAGETARISPAEAPILTEPLGMFEGSAEELIITELPPRDWVLEVEQTAIYNVTITNGGLNVAWFGVKVEGPEVEHWDIKVYYEARGEEREIKPEDYAVKLDPGQRATVTVSITPPRQPSSHAGRHPLSITVTSPEYPGHFSRQNALLTIKPYYQFNIGELVPKEQMLRWRKAFGRAEIMVTNKGNSPASYIISAQDTRQACTFEFEVPGEEASQAQQAEVRLESDTALTVPITITPQSNPLFGVKRAFSFTATTRPMEGTQVPRSVQGQLERVPPIGPLLVALFVLLMVTLCVWFARPQISEFEANGIAVKVTAIAGTPVALSWHTSPFVTEWKIDPLIGAVTANTGNVTIDPESLDTIFVLWADNLISKVIPQLRANKQVRVLVTPVQVEALFQVRMPDGRTITSPTSEKLTIYAGETIELSWVLSYTAESELVINNQAQPLSGSLGRYSDAPKINIKYTLVGRNRYTSVQKDLEIEVIPPPPATPYIIAFFANPDIVIQGTPVALAWEVANVKTVSISGVGANLPAKHEVAHRPMENTNYLLEGSNDAGDIVRATRQVYVTPAPSPTPTPQAPVIEYFTISPQQVVRGSTEASSVKLTWLVKGAYTNIELNSPDYGIMPGQSPTGTVTIFATKSSTFILTAYNGDLSNSKLQQLTVLEPTATGTPPPPPPTGTPTPPAPQIVYFLAESGESPPVPSDVVPISSTQGVAATYLVRKDALVKFRWFIRYASTVTFMSVDAPPEGENFQTVQVKRSGLYRLSAQNPTGRVDRVIELVVNLPVIPPPYDVSGSGGVGGVPPLIITWRYNLQYQSQIIGFRVYRANLSQADYVFELVADESQLDQAARDWSDTELPACGKAYYVVAVYLDPDTGNPIQTSPSPESWYSPACSSP